MPLDRNFWIIGGVVRSQTKRYISTTKRAIGLKLKTWVSSMVELINHTSNSISEKKIPYRGFPQIGSQMSKFAPNLADITKPLRDSLVKGNQWVWEEPQQKAFNQIKQMLTISHKP